MLNRSESIAQSTYTLVSNTDHRNHVVQPQQSLAASKVLATSVVKQPVLGQDQLNNIGPARSSAATVPLKGLAEQVSGHTAWCGTLADEAYEVQPAAAQEPNNMEGRLTRQPGCVGGDLGQSYSLADKDSEPPVEKPTGEQLFWCASQPSIVFLGGHAVAVGGFKAVCFMTIPSK